MRRIAQERDEDDEILRDGQSLRVRMTMIDQAMHRAIDEVYPRTIKDARTSTGIQTAEHAATGRCQTTSLFGL